MGKAETSAAAEPLQVGRRQHTRPGLGVVERVDRRRGNHRCRDRSHACRHDRQQRPEQARRPDFAGACRLAERLAVAEEQRWPRENHRLVAKTGDRVFHLALDAAVEDTRAAIGAERRDDRQPSCACFARSARNGDHEIKVDGAKSRFRSGDLDRRAEGDVGVVDRAGLAGKRRHVADPHGQAWVARARRRQGLARHHDDALSTLGFNDFNIRLNHRQVLTGILGQAGVSSDKHNEALIALDKMDKAGPEGVARELHERGVAAEAAVRLMRFFEGLAGAEHAADLIDLPDSRAAYNADVLGRLVEFIGAHEQGARGVDDLRQILQLAKASGADARIKLDPTLARGLAYYTGAIIEINVADLTGSLGGGGRYDNLVGMFLGKDVPACGFSLGLERIIVVMTEREMFPPALVTSPADVMVTVWNEDSVSESLALAGELRRQGLRVDVYPEADKMAKQFKYASSREIPFVAIIGDDERARDEVAVKDMRSGEQRPVKRADVVNTIRRE